MIKINLMCYNHVYLMRSSIQNNRDMKFIEISIDKIFLSQFFLSIQDVISDTVKSTRLFLRLWNHSGLIIL